MTGVLVQAGNVDPRRSLSQIYNLNEWETLSSTDELSGGA
jgi:hypothetical protein